MEQIPVRVRRGPSKKFRAEQEAKEAQLRAEKMATLAMIGVSLNAMFGVAALTRGPHWELSDAESHALAQSLDAALNTLPGSIYTDIKQYVEKIVPWVSLAYVGYCVVGDRIKTDREIARAIAAKNATARTTESTGAADNEFTTETSLANGAKNRDTFSDTNSGSDTFAGYNDAGNAVEKMA